MSQLPYLPRKRDGSTYRAVELARPLNILKTIKANGGSMYQKELSDALNSQGGGMAEMTLEKELSRMIEKGDLIAKRLGRKTVYSIPSTIDVLDGYETDLETSVNIRQYVYDNFVKRYDKFDAMDKIVYLHDNLKYLLNDINALMVLDAMRKEKGLHADIEDTLRANLKRMLALVASDKKDRDIILGSVISNLLKD